MSDIVQEPIVVVSDPSQVKVKLFNRWSFGDVQVDFLFVINFMRYLKNLSSLFGNTKPLAPKVLENKLKTQNLKIHTSRFH
jgi:hypothetical protein